MLQCSLTNEVLVGLSPVASSYNSNIAPVSSKDFFDIQATIECELTLKLRDMTFNSTVQISTQKTAQSIKAGLAKWWSVCL